LKDRREYLISKMLTLTVKMVQEVETGMPLAIAPLDLKDVLTVRGLRSTQEYIISQVQKVYESRVFRFTVSILR